MHRWQIRYTQSNLNAHGNLFRFNCATETNEEARWSGRTLPQGWRSAGGALAVSAWCKAGAIWFCGRALRRGDLGASVLPAQDMAQKTHETLCRESAQARLSWWAQDCCCQIWAGSRGVGVTEPRWTQADLTQSWELSLHWSHQHIQSYLYQLDFSNKAPSPH